MQKGIERRRHPRLATYIIARYTVKEGMFRDVIKNISAGGLYITTMRDIAVGQSIELEFPLFDVERNIRIRGKVVRRDEHGIAVAFDELLEGLSDEDGGIARIVDQQSDGSN